MKLATFKFSILLNIFFPGIATESVHAALRQSDRIHNCQSNNNLGSDSHLRMSLNSILFFNDKNAFRASKPTSPPPLISIPRVETVSVDIPDTESPLPVSDPVPEPPPDPVPEPAPITDTEEDDPLTVAVRNSGLRLRKSQTATSTEVGNCW